MRILSYTFRPSQISNVDELIEYIERNMEWTPDIKISINYHHYGYCYVLLIKGEDETIKNIKKLVIEYTNDYVIELI